MHQAALVENNLFYIPARAAVMERVYKPLAVHLDKYQCRANHYHPQVLLPNDTK